MPSITVIIDTDDLPGVEQETNARSVLHSLLITSWRTYQSQKSAQLNSELATTLTDTCESVADDLTTITDKFGYMERQMGEQNRKLTEAIQSLTAKVLQDSGKSVVKGSVLEKELMKVLQESLPEHGVEHTGASKNSGDILVTKNTFHLLIDAKNYTQTVEKKEVEKLKRDMERMDVSCGAIISTSPVRGFVNRDLHFFTDTAGKLRVIGILGSLRDTTPIPMVVYFLESVFYKMIETPLEVNKTYQDESTQKFAELRKEVERMREVEKQYAIAVKQSMAPLDGFRTILRSHIQALILAVGPSPKKEEDEQSDEQSVEEKPESKFDCDICGSSYKKAGGLKRHTEKMHKQ
jgi:hypothetical protein